MADYVIDQRNNNRYKVIVKEELGYTAYCFSTPIYNLKTRRLVNMHFNKTNNIYSFTGSNGIISICQNKCVLDNMDGKIQILLNQPPMVDITDRAQPDVYVVPTLNGVRFMVKDKSFSFRLKADTNYDSIRFSSTSFSVMKDKFQPIVTVATLYATNCNGEILPIAIKYNDLGNQTYELKIFNASDNEWLFFEINLYEQKLFQDTIVESTHPDDNNVYSAMGFIGKHIFCGEQWLFTRPDFSKISDLISRHIDKILFHIPVINKHFGSIDTYIPASRFCSFGSTWNTKVNILHKHSNISRNGDYITIDVTDLFANQSDHMLVYNEGIILKELLSKNNCMAIATGDCYSFPQILEIQYK